MTLTPAFKLLYRGGSGAPSREGSFYQLLSLTSLLLPTLFCPSLTTFSRSDGHLEKDRPDRKLFSWINLIPVKVKSRFCDGISFPGIFAGVSSVGIFSYGFGAYLNTKCFDGFGIVLGFGYKAVPDFSLLYPGKLATVLLAMWEALPRSQPIKHRMSGSNYYFYPRHRVLRSFVEFRIVHLHRLVRQGTQGSSNVNPICFNCRFCRLESPTTV